MKKSTFQSVTANRTYPCALARLAMQTQVESVGGDKPIDECKPNDGEEQVACRQVLARLVKAISVAHSVGKTPQDF